MSSPNPGPTTPFSLALRPIHTFEHLLASLNALSQRDNFPFSAALLNHLQQATVQLANVRYLVDCKLRSCLYTQEVQFYASFLECLTDIEELGVEGWVEWIEMQRRAEHEKAREAKIVGEVVRNWMDNFQTEEEENENENERVSDRCAARLQHQEKHPEHITMQNMFDEEEQMRRSDTESPPTAQSPSSRSKYHDGISMNVRSHSTQSEVGSLMSGKIGRNYIPWTHFKNQPRGKYPWQPMASTTDPNTNQVDSEQEFHDDDLQWKYERKDMYKYKDHRHSSPPRCEQEILDQISPYLQIPLPAGFMMQNHDPHSCPFTFKGPSSVFYFPFGISRERLLFCLRNGYQHGRMAPSFEFGDTDVIQICTPDMKRELHKAIAKTGVLFNLVDKNGVVKVGVPWDGESQGDIYIVSGPESNPHVQNTELPGTEQDKYSSTAEVKSHILSFPPPLLRGGDVDSSFAPYCFVPPPTIVDTSNHLLADLFLDKTNIFYWMQQAHTLQLKLLDMQDKYHQLEKKYQDARSTLANEDRQLDELIKKTGYWMDEAQMARTNEGNIRMKLLSQSQAIRVHRKSVEDMKDGVKLVADLIKELKAALRNEGLLQQSPTQMTTWCDSPPTRRQEQWHREQKEITPQQGFKALKGHHTLRGGGGSLNAAPLASPESRPGNGVPVARDIEVSGFYFFPGIATIATQTEPVHYFQWPYDTTLMQIRNTLQDRHLKGTENHPVLLCIRKIFQKRDELCIPDPDVSMRNPVFISIPTDDSPHVLRQKSELRPPRELTDESTKEWCNSAKNRQPNATESINALRRGRGESNLDFILNQTSDSDSESRFKSIGNLINILNGAVDSADEYEHELLSELEYGECPGDVKINFRYPWSSGGDTDTHNIRPGSPQSTQMSNYQTGLDEKESNSNPDVVSRMFPRFQRVEKHTGRNSSHIQEHLEKHLPHDPRYEDSYEFPHAKGKGCESWTGYLDSLRDRCTYCDLAFVELEPHRSASHSSSITSENHSRINSSESSAYRFSPTPVDPYIRGGADIDTYMTTSWPLKVCTNPFAELPFDQKKSHVPTPFSKLKELIPCTACTNRCAVPPPLDNLQPPKITVGVASTNSSRLPSSCKKAKSNENSGPELARDYYRRQAEEPTIEERIEKVEALACELTKLTRRCEEKGVLLQRLVSGHNHLVEPTAQVRSPPHLRTSIDIEDQLALTWIERVQRRWERRCANVTKSQDEDRSILETSRIIPRPRIAKDRPMSRAQSPWIGDIEDAVEYIVAPSIPTFPGSSGRCGSRATKMDVKALLSNATSTGSKKIWDTSALINKL